MHENSLTNFQSAPQYFWPTRFSVGLTGGDTDWRWRSSFLGCCLHESSLAPQR